MLVKTLLNKCFRMTSFVYDTVHFREKPQDETEVEPSQKKEVFSRLEIFIKPRKNSKIICSGCGQPAPGYDKLKQRSWEFIPLWGIAVFFIYTMRRVDCKNCGKKVEKVPWADGKSSMTKVYMMFLAHWAKTLSWYEVAVRFNTSWQKVYQSVQYVVGWGLEKRVLSGIEAIGVDEIAWKKGHKYLTVVYEISKDSVRLLWVSKNRTQESFRFFLRCSEKRSVS